MNSLLHSDMFSPFAMADLLKALPAVVGSESAEIALGGLDALGTR